MIILIHAIEAQKVACMCAWQQIVFHPLIFLQILSAQEGQGKRAMPLSPCPACFCPMPDFAPCLPPYVPSIRCSIYFQ